MDNLPVAHKSPARLTARGAGRFGLGEHPAPISGKMAVCTNHRHPEGGERDAAQDYPQSCPENQIVRVGCGSLGGGRPLSDSGKWNCILGPIAGRCARAVGRAARGTIGCRPGASRSCTSPKHYVPVIPVRPVLGDEGVFDLCAATGAVYALRGTGGGDALGGGQTSGDPDLRLVSGELGEASFLEGGGRGLPKQLGRGLRCGRDGGGLWPGAPGSVGDPVSWHRRDRPGGGAIDT